jgi:two-component system sensor histidine kinase UhpB
VFVANAAVLVTAVFLLAALPVTVSWPPSVGELIVLACGLAVMLVANLLLMRRLLTPLRRLRRVMSTVDPLMLGRPVDVGARSIEVAALTASFNAMLARIDQERRDSSRRAQAAQEHERRALSLELHDQIGQNLTALLLQLDVVSRTATEEQSAKLEALIETVRECLEQVRAIVRRLRPEALDELGLITAIDHLCDRVESDSGLAIERALDPDLPGLSSDAQLVVYRVLQESLTNVVRHAGSLCAHVELAPVDGGVRLSVRDDGAGLGEAVHEGSGIRGMRERALMIGATLDVRPLDSSGTEVTLQVPEQELV